jgi:hypothetical protein
MQSCSSVEMARRLRFSAALSRRPADQLARPLGRFQDERLVGFDNAGDQRRALVLCRLQKAVTPAEQGLQTHVGALGRLPEADASDQGARLVEPGIAATQLRQRRAGERVEGAAAVLAFVSLEAACLAPATEALRLTVAARRFRREARFDQRDRRVRRSLAGQRRRERRAAPRSDNPTARQML